LIDVQATTTTVLPVLVSSDARGYGAEPVIGVPARDVVIVTGSRSPAGLAKARRAVDRVFFAGGPHLLTPHLLVRRDRSWHVYAEGHGYSGR
jgi:hypothetical protein